METFDDIYLDMSKQSGRCRFAEQGVGWKPQGGDTSTCDREQIVSAHWSRASRGFEVKIYRRDSGMVQLDGFLEEDFDRLAKAMKLLYTVNLENKEHSLRGWNWGKADFGKAELTFNVQNRPAFEVPYSEIVNSNLAGKNEVAVELSLPNNGEDTGTNGHLGGARARGRKAGGARDQLVEMRFYVPGTITKTIKAEGDGEEGEEGGEEDVEEEQNAANLFYDTLLEKAEIGDVAGDTYATFLDILTLTPRGRFDIDMYEKSFRLRGKTYDYRIQYDHIKRFMVLPKPDEIHILIVFGLDPPLRQGQTRYPFLVMQFKRDEEVVLDLNMKEEELKEKYGDKIQSHYEAPTSSVIANVFRGLSGKKLLYPSKDFTSHHDQKGVKCSIKANEGHLFFLDKSLMFVPKPATFIQIDSIASITLSRVGGAIAASRTFDMNVTAKAGMGQWQFSNINREEQTSIEDFFREKKIKVKNEMNEDTAMLAAALNAEDLASSEDEVVGANRGSADEDSESDDEDFKADSDSDLAEEYDSQHESSGSDSDAEMGDADADADADGDAGDDDEEERPKKKVKGKK